MVQVAMASADEQRQVRTASVCGRVLNGAAYNIENVLYVLFVMNGCKPFLTVN